eukprot:4962362-Pyramimonas_sp.AAC.1
MQSPPLTSTLTSTLAFPLERPSDDAPHFANWLLHKPPQPACMFWRPKNNHCACRSSARYVGLRRYIGVV